MRTFLSLFLVITFLYTCSPGPVQNSSPVPSSRIVQNNIIVSDTLPIVRIKVDSTFRYIGNFNFEILANSEEYEESLRGHPIAAGERVVFVNANSEMDVNKLFIAQFEGFLPHLELKYNYNFDQAEMIGNNKYRQNTWFYNSKEQELSNPDGEGAKTRKFLEDKGFKLADEFMMSRFVGLASEDRINEIILYYIEMLPGTSGFTLDELEEDNNQEAYQRIREGLIERSKGSFQILEG